MEEEALIPLVRNRKSKPKENNLNNATTTKTTVFGFEQTMRVSDDTPHQRQKRKKNTNGILTNRVRSMFSTNSESSRQLHIIIGLEVCG